MSTTHALYILNTLLVAIASALSPIGYIVGQCDGPSQGNTLWTNEGDTLDGCAIACNCTNDCKYFSWGALQGSGGPVYPPDTDTSIGRCSMRTAACEIFTPKSNPSYKVHFKKQSNATTNSSLTPLECILTDIEAVYGYKKLGVPSLGKMNLDGGGGSSSSGVKTLYNQTVNSCQSACECSPYCIGISMQYNETTNYTYTGECKLENWLKNTPGQSQYYLTQNVGSVFYYRVDGSVGENPCLPTLRPTMAPQMPSYTPSYSPITSSPTRMTINPTTGQPTSATQNPTTNIPTGAPTQLPSIMLDSPEDGCYFRIVLSFIVVITFLLLL